MIKMVEIKICSSHLQFLTRLKGINVAASLFWSVIENLIHCLYYSIKKCEHLLSRDCTPVMISALSCLINYMSATWLVEKNVLCVQLMLGPTNLILSALITSIRSMVFWILGVVTLVFYSTRRSNGNRKLTV